MYTIKCDGYPLLDLRDGNLMVQNPKCHLKVNAVGDASFTIYSNHPYYDYIKPMKSIFEISDDIGVIFRGRMTDESLDFNNGKNIDLEGAMAFFNDSVVAPYSFPDDFEADDAYTSAEKDGNVVQFFLKWLIDNHNAQVQEFQRLKLGHVTVSDPNNYITRSNMEISSTWDVLKEKLFDSSLGGNLCIRYESDGTYVDYLSEFTIYNTQSIEFGKNLLDLKHDTDANNTYSAMVPYGAQNEDSNERITIGSVEDGLVSGDIYKTTLSNGLHALYSQKAVELYGWICAPAEDSTWDDVTEASNLLKKGVERLAGQGIMLADSVTINAVDLHLSDESIQSFRIYRKVVVNSNLHSILSDYNLTELDIDILNPQNTKITVGDTKLALTDQRIKRKTEYASKIEEAMKDIQENQSNISEQKQISIEQQTQLINSCTEIIMKALESYVENDNFEEYQRSVSAQLSIISESIGLKFTENTQKIENVDGDVKEIIHQLSKYFDFSIEGLTIKAGEHDMKLRIDNDVISFEKNGVQFGWWDGVDFHTGNIVVDLNERAQFGSFAFVPRSDGSLSFLKVDDV